MLELLQNSDYSSVFDSFPQGLSAGASQFSLLSSVFALTSVIPQTELSRLALTCFLVLFLPFSFDSRALAVSSTLPLRSCFEFLLLIINLAATLLVAFVCPRWRLFCYSLVYPFSRRAVAYPFLSLADLKVDPACLMENSPTLSRCVGLNSALFFRFTGSDGLPLILFRLSPRDSPLRGETSLTRWLYTSLCALCWSPLPRPLRLESCSAPFPLRLTSSRQPL